MKKQYTEMVTSLRRARKRTGRTNEQIHQDMLDELAAHPSAASSFRKAVGTMELMYETAGKFRHVFLPNAQFCDWLADCTRTFDPELTDGVVRGLGDNFICLHFPTDAKKASAICWLGVQEDGAGHKGHVLLSFSMDAPWGGGAIDTRFDRQDVEELRQKTGFLADDANQPCAVDDERSRAAGWYVRFIAGLGLYMSCFPEQVREGIPEDAKRAEYARDNAKTIGVAESVVCRDGPTPHYRVGHFRLLSSDRYVNKRGQVVFVHGTFVKGRAATVLDMEGATHED